MGCPLCPLSKLPLPQPQQLQTTSHFWLFPALGLLPGVRLTPCALPPPTKGVGDGHTSAPGSPEELHPFPPAYPAPSLTQPLGLQGSRKGGCEGGGDRRVRGHSSPTEGHSRKQTLIEATPSAPPPFARGGSRLPREGFPRRLGTRQGPHGCHSLKERLPPRSGTRRPSPPPPSGSCCSLRLRSGSTSFLRRESARVVCCWGVRWRRFEITWLGGHGLRGRERGRVGWLRQEPPAMGDTRTSPSVAPPRPRGF